MFAYSQVGESASALPMLTDSSAFEWNKLTLRADTVFMLAIALCLALGIALGHPGAGLIAASGAMTVGLGAKQSIDDSRLLPMIFVNLGIAFSTFAGMVVGHTHFSLVLAAMLWGFGYGLLSNRPAGYLWVAQECVIFLLVGSAFPFSPRDAVIRAALVLAGGAIQILFTSILLRLLPQAGRNLLGLARYIQTEELLLRATLSQTSGALRRGQISGKGFSYGLRVMITLGVSTFIYTYFGFQSGYWIPVTALLVLKPGLTDTVNRAVARTLGTVLGAILASFWLARLDHPSLLMLAGCTLLCVWLAYGTVHVNYALYSLFLTAYVVFLLSLGGISGTVIAQHRTICTVIGGALALTVRLTVIRYRRRTPEVEQAAGAQS